MIVAAVWKTYNREVEADDRNCRRQLMFIFLSSRY
jgi:hypothetical protein